jgi:predicted ferric reductase
MEENGLQFTDQDLEHLTKNLFDDADHDDTGELSFENLVQLLNRSPGLLENVAISVEQWLLPSLPTKSHLARRVFGRKFSVSYIKNNLPSFVFLVAFITVNLGLIGGRFYTYRDYSYYARLAKSGGQCLNFTCALTIVLMLRKSITILRSYGWAKYLPLDNSIYYHKIIGYFITVYASVHTVFHCFHFSEYFTFSLVEDSDVDFFKNLLIESPSDDISHRTNVSLSDYLFTVRENTWPREYSPVTGWMLLAILVVMVLSSLPVMRRTGNFEIFYYCHLLYVAFYVILILHAPRFWYWFLIPGVIFILEALNRIRNSFGSHGYTYIVQGVLLPSRVVHLIIKRPPNFNFSPGDFVYVQIPGVAKTEWHPFTISSAPEMSDYLWLHIRAVGEWTNRVYDYFLTEEQKLMDSKSDANSRKSPSIGPFTFEMPLKRGKSFPPMSRTFTAMSPITRTVDRNMNVIPEDNFMEGPNCHQMQCNGNPVERMSSTPIPTAVRPAFGRTLSTIEPRLRIPFDRRQSKVFVLPKPTEMNDDTCRKKRFNRLISRNTKRPMEVVVEEGSTHSIEDQEAQQFSELLQMNPDASEALLSGKMIKLEKPLHLHLDGPYGSPTSHIFYTEHAILIGTGIGVTPFASILQSIMFRYMKAKSTCPNCHHSWSDPIPPNIMNLKKVDFMWINRHQKSFEWFVSLLSELEITQAMLHEKDRFLDIHMYVTSALDKSDMKAIGLQLALDLMHEKEKRDLITGLKTRTNPGRPDWDAFFREMANQKKGRVTVFFCGPPQLGRIIQSHCIPFGFAFKKEIF